LPVQAVARAASAITGLSPANGSTIGMTESGRAIDCYAPGSLKTRVLPDGG
jgi:hypothetical protein